MKTGKLLTCLLTMTTLATALPIHAAALIGDLNNDGVVDKQDAKILSEYFAGYPHDIDTVAADVNADGKVTRQDGMILNRYADGWDGYEIATEEEAAAAIYTQALDEEHIQTATFTEEDETYESMYVDNEILIVVDEDLVGREYVETLVEPYGGTVVGQVPIVGFYQVEIEGTPTLAKLEEVIDAVSDAEHAEDAYLNTVMEYGTDAYYPNDPYDGSDNLWDDSSRTWHLRATHVPEAWELVYSVNDDPSIVMGVIDDNFDENHPDLDINILSRKNNQLTGESDPDGVKHGTHVAGILGAKTNNTEGVCGIAINPTIYCVAEQREAYQADRSGLGAQAEWIEDYSRIIEESRNNGKKMIINMSLGYGTSSYKPTKDEVEQITNSLLKLEDDGYDFLIVTSAGNQGRDSKHNTVKNSFITAITDESIKDNIIVVGNARPVNYSNNSVVNDASFSDGFIRFEGSSYRGGRVDIMAPGTDVVSTIASSSSPVWRLPQGYSKLTGTSQASPVVAGIAALVWEANPNLTPEQVKEILIDTADIPVDGNGDDDCPNMVNAEAAVRKAISYRKDISRLTAHAIDNETNAGISNATIRLSFVDSTGTTTATSDPFTLSNIGIDMYFNTDSVYNTAIVSADGYTTKTIQLTEDNMITENTILHYSLGDVRLEKVVEETTHTVSGTVVDANGALAGVTVACSHGTTTTSNASGSYSFALPDGTYTLTFTLDGYETTTRTVTVNGSDCSVDVVTMATVVEEDIVASGECGADGNNVIWTLDETGILTLSGSGAIADYAYENWTDYLDSITSVNINEGITSIGNMSFSKLKKMTSISLPSTLTKIGGFAFSNCEILMSVTIPDSVTELGSYTFWNCLNLREIEIPSGIKTIPSHAFYECHALRKVTFNEGLTTIGFMAFAYCFCLDSISFPDSLTTIATQAFVNCSNLSHVEYPRNWTTVLEEKSQGNMSPFKDCYALNEIVIPDCVTQIPNGAFYSCKYLKTIVLPNGLTTIGNYAFSGTAIKAIDIPDSVTTIGVDAFSNTPLETVYIPKFVDDIGAFAFNNCNQLKSVYFYGNVPSRTPRDIFTGTDITIYYPEDAEGWTTPTYTFSFGITYNTEIFDSSVIFENTLSGKVTNSDNNPLLNAYILVYDSHKELVGSTSTDSEGVYTFTFTNKGVYYIYSESDGYVLNEPLVTAVNTNTLTLSTIVMETKSSVPTYEIVGYIVDAKTNAYLSAYGSIIGPGGSASFGSYESIGFYYSVSVPGTYEITIKQEGYEPYICLIDVNSPINSFVFELTPSDNLGNYCMFSGKVTDVNGESIEGASITVCNENTTDSVVATTNADGLFAGALTSVGTYSITISKEGYTISPDSYGTEYTEYTEGMNGIHLGTYILMTIPEIKIIASGECGMNGDNVTWTLDDSYALTVTGTGEMADYSYTSDNLAPWSSYRDQITSITIGEGITDTGEFTFYYCQNVTGEIAIPNGIETIGKCSFEGCKNVTYYNIPATVQQIDGFAFKDNTNLISFVIPDGVTCIGESAFEGCNSLTSIHFPDSLTTIEKHAFKNCYVLSSVTFPESLKCIGDYSFWSANGFTEIYIPANVNYIGIFAFSFSGSLEKITVSPENAYYCSDDYGVLFNKSMTQLYQYPKAKHRDSYIVPEGVTKITKYAFAQCAIKDVVLSSTVTVIESCAFWNCGVYTLTIPASVTRIGKNNLYCSYYITDVYFYGDVPANFEEGFNQGGNSALTLHYIEGKSGWTTPTWTAPDGKVYNTAVWNP